MHRPRILDVVRAVAEAAPSYPEVAVWWYAPTKEFRLQEVGEERAGGARSADAVDLVVEWGSEPTAADERCARIAADLSARLGAYPVRVRARSEFDVGRPLFRLLGTHAPGVFPRPPQGDVSRERAASAREPGSRSGG